MPLSLRAQRVQVVAPASGTMLWADLWAVPAGAGAPHGPSPLLPLWFELPLQPARWCIGIVVPDCAGAEANAMQCATFDLAALGGSMFIWLTVPTGMSAGPRS